MIKYIAILHIACLVSVVSGCKKDNTPVYINCSECNIDKWVGEYTGVGDYFDGENSFLDVNTTITIENTYDNYLRTTVVVESGMTETLITKFDETGYSIHVQGSNQSMDLTLSTDGSRFRLTGTIKSYINHIAIGESISFEVYK